MNASIFGKHAIYNFYGTKKMAVVGLSWDNTLLAYLVYIVHSLKYYKATLSENNLKVIFELIVAKRPVELLSLILNDLCNNLCNLFS